MEHDAADQQRLLLLHAQRHRVSRRASCAAELRSARRCRGELRRDRATIGHEMATHRRAKAARAIRRRCTARLVDTADADVIGDSRKTGRRSSTDMSRYPATHQRGGDTGREHADLAGLQSRTTPISLSLGGKEAPVIDGLTGDQRFFLAFAASWKEICRPRNPSAIAADRRTQPGQVPGQRDRPQHGRVVCRVRRAAGRRVVSAPEDRVRVW